MNTGRSETLFQAGDPEAGKTLVTALRGWQPGRSWSQLRKLIRARRVTVNGALCLDEARKLIRGDTVQLQDESLQPPPGEKDVVLHYLDEDLVVVCKPAGMLAERHHAERRWPQQRKDRHPTLEEIVPRRIAAHQANRRRGSTRVFSVHRIDRDTSGLLLFARNEFTQKRLIAQFAKHDVERVYLAVVAGRPGARTIASMLVRDRGDGLRGSSEDLERGRRAITHIRPLESFSDYTMLECRLETGRTHQIRIHLAELGHPVCGDGMYRGPLGSEPIVDSSHAPRLALHATRLGFAHPGSGELLQFETPLPPDLDRFVSRLRGDG